MTINNTKLKHKIVFIIIWLLVFIKALVFIDVLPRAIITENLLAA